MIGVVFHKNLWEELPDVFFVCQLTEDIHMGWGFVSVDDLKSGSQIPDVINVVLKNAW